VDSFALGYYVSGCIMVTAGVVGMALGINAENTPLEEIWERERNKKNEFCFY